MNNTEKQSIIDQNSELYFVAIEWDGQKPPSRWYRWMSKLAGGGVQGAVTGEGPDILNPIDRRTTNAQGQGLTFQEGFILAPSKSFVEVIVGILENDMTPFMVERGKKPPTYIIGKADVDREYSPSRQANSNTRRAIQALGRRGRRPDPIEWVVQCNECLTASSVVASEPINCPACSGMKINKRRGRLNRWKDNGAIDIVALWKVSRYSHAFMESSPIVGENELGNSRASDPYLIHGREEYLRMNRAEREWLDTFESSGLLSKVRAMPRIDAVRVLDALMVTYSKTPAEEVSNARNEAFVTYMMAFMREGADEDEALMFLNDEPDLLDLAAVLGPKVAAQLALQYHSA